MKKTSDELTVTQAAEKLNVVRSTLNKWISDKKAPAVYRGRNRYLKASTVSKIESAIMSHGTSWFRHVSFTAYEKFEAPILEAHLAGVKSEALPKEKTASSLGIELAVIAKKLKTFGENELAARVSLRAVEMM